MSIPNVVRQTSRCRVEPSLKQVSRQDQHPAGLSPSAKRQLGCNRLVLASPFTSGNTLLHPLCCADSVLSFFINPIWASAGGSMVRRGTGAMGHKLRPKHGDNLIARGRVDPASAECCVVLLNQEKSGPFAGPLNSDNACWLSQVPPEDVQLLGRPRIPSLRQLRPFWGSHGL